MSQLEDKVSLVDKTKVDSLLLISQSPVLTPSSMLHLQPTQLPGLSPHHLQETDLRKRDKYLLRCKEAMWSRWSKEYVRSLRERHRRSGGEQTPHPSVGDVVIIQDESRNRHSWKLGIVDELIVGRDGIICEQERE